MRVRIVAILLLLMQAQLLYAQAPVGLASYRQNPAPYQKLETYQSGAYKPYNLDEALKAERTKHPLVKTGKILTFVGIPLMIVGGIMVANADALYYQCVNGECEGDASGGFGVIILAAGAGLTGTGIVLWTIGSNKSKN